MKAKNPISFKFPDPAYEQANFIPDTDVRDGWRRRNVNWKRLEGSDQKIRKIKCVRNIRNR
jgi:hypothetical protein